MLGFVIVLHLDYEKLTFSAFNLQYLKNIVFDVFLFINYEDLGKSTIPSTGSQSIELLLFMTCQAHLESIITV